MPLLSQIDVPLIDTMGDGTPERFAARVRDLMAEGTWLVRTPLFFSVLDHDGVRALQRDPRLHTLGVRLVEMQGVTEGLLHDRASDNILALEGEPHTRLRGLVSRALTPRAVERLRPLMVEWLTARLDRIDASQPFDFMDEVAEEYPIAMICALVGAPAEDWPLFSAWATSVFKQFQFTLAEDRDEVEQAIGEIADYTDALMDRRADDPGDDLISALLAVEEAGDRVSRDEVRSLVTTLLLAGTDTTRNQLGLGVLLFAHHPDQWARLVADPTLIPAAVEEVLRFDPTAGATPRVVVEEMTFRDVTFPAGTPLALMSISANRDAAHLARPDVFDITADRGSFSHLTFGSGPHYCLGANLARAELQEAFTLLVERWATIELAGEPEMRPPVGIYGPARLPIRVTPRSTPVRRGIR